MEISYPVFYQDQDGWMCMLNSLQEIQTQIEQNDVYDEEYKVWDAKGRVLELYLDKKEIEVRMLSSKSRLEELRKAILHYAEVAKPKVSFITTSVDNDVVKLFSTVEKHIEK